MSLTLSLLLHYILTYLFYSYKIVYNKIDSHDLNLYI